MARYQFITPTFFFIIQVLGVIVCEPYKVQLQNVEQSNYRNTFLDWNFELVAFNSTINVINGEVTILKDIPMEIMVRVIGYEKKGNNYYPSLVDATFQICDFLKQQPVEKIFLLKSNFPKDCPITKGKYTVTNMLVDSDDVPERLSARYWMMEIQIWSNELTIGNFKAYARVDAMKKTISNKNI